MDPEELARISRQIFGPRRRTTDLGFQSPSEGIIQTLPIYYWPIGITLDEQTRTAFLCFFAALGRSKTESPSAWATWAFSFCVLSFPEMKEAISRFHSHEYTFRPLSKE